MQDTTKRNGGCNIERLEQYLRKKGILVCGKLRKLMNTNQSDRCDSAFIS